MPQRVRTFIDFVMERLGGSKHFQLDAAELNATALRNKAKRRPRSPARRSAGSDLSRGGS
jgi:hypothetical protein